MNSDSLHKKIHFALWSLVIGTLIFAFLFLYFGYSALYKTETFILFTFMLLVSGWGFRILSTPPNRTDELSILQLTWKKYVVLSNLEKIFAVLFAGIEVLMYYVAGPSEWQFIALGELALLLLIHFLLKPGNTKDILEDYLDRLERVPSFSGFPFSNLTKSLIEKTGIKASRYILRSLQIVSALLILGCLYLWLLHSLTGYFIGACLLSLGNMYLGILQDYLEVQINTRFDKGYTL